MFRFVPFVAGVIEFTLCGFMFLMAAFGVTGYLILSWNPLLNNGATAVESDLGFFAVVAFVFSLAGAMSALKRWSVVLSVVGASFVTCWGLLENWFSLTFPLDTEDVVTGVILSTFAIFSSMVVIALVAATKEYFKPHALRRAGTD